MSNRGGHQSSYCGHQGIPLGHPQHRTFLPPNCGHGGVYPPSRPGVLNQEGLSMPQSIPSNQNQNLASLGIPRIPGQSLIHQSHMHHGSQMHLYNQGMASNSPFMYSSYPSMYHMYHQAAMPCPYSDGPTGRSLSGPGINSTYPGMTNNTDNANYTSEISQFPHQTMRHSSAPVSQASVSALNTPVYPGSYTSYGSSHNHSGLSDLWHLQGSDIQHRAAFGYSTGSSQVAGSSGGSSSSGTSNVQNPRSGRSLPLSGISNHMNTYHQTQSKQATQPQSQQPQPSPQQQPSQQFQSQASSRSYCNTSGGAPPSSSLIGSHLSSSIAPMSPYPSPQSSTFSSHNQQQALLSRPASSGAGPPPQSPQNVRPFSSMSYPPSNSSPIDPSMSTSNASKSWLIASRLGEQRQSLQRSQLLLCSPWSTHDQPTPFMIPPLGANVRSSVPSSRYTSHQQHSSYSLGQNYSDASSVNSSCMFSELNFPPVDTSNTVGYPHGVQMNSDCLINDKKKERPKKHKKKDKDKPMERLPASNSHPTFPPTCSVQPDASEEFLNYLNQTLGPVLQSHFDQSHSEQSHPTSTHQPMTSVSVNQQQQQQQNQFPHSTDPLMQPTPHLSSTNSPIPSSEPSSNHSQQHLHNTLMTQDDIVTRTSPCFDANTLDLGPELLNSSLTNHLSDSRMPIQQTQPSQELSFCEYEKKEESQMSVSQSLAISHPASTEESTIMNDEEKLATLEEDLNYLTAAESASSKIKSSEIGTQAGPQLVPESHILPPSSTASSAITLSPPVTSANPSIKTNCDPLLTTANTSCSISTLTSPMNFDANTSTSKESTSFSSVTLSTEASNEQLQRCKISPNTPSQCANDSNENENKQFTETTVKKKKKLKESKLKNNGVKVTKVALVNAKDNNNSKRGESRIDSSVKIVPVKEECTIDRTSLPASKCVTTCKPLEITNFRKSTDQEAKFFKIRPTTNANLTTISPLNSNVSDSSIKNSFKGSKKRKIEETTEKSTHDEYEFPDSPNPTSYKKSKKVNSENTRKKSDKLSSANFSIVGKKLNSTLKTKINSAGNTALTKLSMNEKNSNNNVKVSQKQQTPSNVSNSSKASENKSQKYSFLVQKKAQTTENKKLPGEATKKPVVSLQEVKEVKSTQITPLTTVTTGSISKTKLSPNTVIANKKSFIAPSPGITIFNDSLHCNQSKLTNQTNFISTAHLSSSQHQNISALTTPCPSPSPTTLTITTPIGVSANTLTTILPIASNNTLGAVAIVNTAATTLSTVPPQPTKPCGNVGTSSAGTNTPRRRSQDKKALTVKEGLMRTGDFVVAIDESKADLPMIWRIEGKSLLQRFEPGEQDGVMVYTNTSSYSAWNPTVRQRYTGVDVRIMGCSRTKIVVEKLGLTKSTNSVNNDTEAKKVEPSSSKATTNITLSAPLTQKNGETLNKETKTPPDRSQENIARHRADFEVSIQTLLSQALDHNFISEIKQENDEYFLQHLQNIDNFCLKKKSRFFTKVKWDAQIVKCVETFSTFSTIPQSQVGDLRCRLCHDKWSTLLLHFTGHSYDPETLELKDPDLLDLKQTKYASCDSCKDKITLFSRLHHQKYNFYMKCREKVEEMRGVDDKDSPSILDHCLKDTKWMESLFKQFEEIWQSCDRMR